MQWLRMRIPVEGAELAGELVLPDGAGPHAVVVVLQGTGEGTRDFYRTHALEFVAAGVGALIFDRRGEGDSSGSNDMDLYQLARDASAVVAAARTAPLVDPGSVGLFGYSNGAWVAALAAATLVPAFLVLTGAAGVSPGVAEVFRRTEDLRRQGVSPAGVAAVERAWTILFDYMAHNAWDPGWDEELPALAAAIAANPEIAALPVSELVRANPQFDSVPRFDSPMLADPKGTLGGRAPYFGFDPIPALAELQCPVLVVLAEDDANVPTAAGLPRFQELAAARPGEFEVHVIPGADHLFSSDGYLAREGERTIHEPRKSEDFLPGYLRLMAEWMAKTAGVPT